MDCNSICLACGLWLVFIYLFIPEKDHRLATIPSLFSMYSTGASLSAQIMRPVWPAQSWSGMSGSFQVRDRDRGTLEIQVNFCSARLLNDSGLLEIWPSRRVEPRELLVYLLFYFSLPFERSHHLCWQARLALMMHLGPKSANSNKIFFMIYTA